MKKSINPVEFHDNKTEFDQRWFLDRDFRTPELNQFAVRFGWRWQTVFDHTWLEVVCNFYFKTGLVLNIRINWFKYCLSKVKIR